ncbi:hypothetical protein [Cyclobacterium plantarum]|uniref:Uncharacterized protein n=1 Tax=Cyclobacterium plantarum TaxID=2716263 RepID=A0ABX0H4S9_9BACT|nr:hypothetical protein [Cyclobacterium plantarum]NHE56850.1 hypothetical protein [Cyclobacterium plantarum]
MKYYYFNRQHMRAVVIFTLIFLLISSTWLDARQNACSVNQMAVQRQIVDLDQNGSLEGFAGDRGQFTLMQYHSNGQKLWELQLPKTSANSKFDLIASADGGEIFVLAISPSLKGPGTALIHQIRKGKLIRTLAFEDQQILMGESLHAVFADKAYLYFLTADQDPDKFRMGKAPKMSFLLNRFSTKDLFFDQVRVELPQIPDSRWNPQWTFAGQLGQEKYMVLKDADLASNTLHCEVISFDPDGHLMRNFELNYTPEKQSIRPSFHVDDNDRNFVLATDYNYLGYASFGPAPSVKAYRIGAFFGFTLDEQTGAFYISGLSGEESFGKNPFHFKAQNYNGFYLSKFNANGDLLWEAGHVADGKHLSETDFRKRQRPVQKYSAIELIAATREVNYSIRVGGNDFSFLMDDKEGELMAINGMLISGQGKALTEAGKSLPVAEEEGLFRMVTNPAKQGKEQAQAGSKPVLAF